MAVPENVLRYAIMKDTAKRNVKMTDKMVYLQ